MIKAQREGEQAVCRDGVCDDEWMYKGVDDSYHKGRIGFSDTLYAVQTRTEASTRPVMDAVQFQGTNHPLVLTCLMNAETPPAD